MLQRNRLNANSFVSVKHPKQTEKLHEYFCGVQQKVYGRRFFGDERQLKAQEFMMLFNVMSCHYAQTIY